MHIIRATMGDYILDETNLPPGTASLMIGHEIPGDRKTDLDRVSRTSKRWYFQSQRIVQRTLPPAFPKEIVGSQQIKLTPTSDAAARNEIEFIGI